MANPKSRKRKKRIIFAAIVAVVGALALMAVFRKKSVVYSVQEDKVARRNLTEIVTASGKIQPVLQVKISPEVSGEIINLPVKEGDLVKKGDLLVTIRPDNYIAARDSSFANYRYALANSNTAAANLEKAQIDYDRNYALFKGKLISDSDYLTAKTTLDVAKASLAGATEQVGMAYASLQSSESDLSKTKIFSPLDGKISQLNSQLGERVVGTAMMAGTEIMTVADLNRMEARVDIGEVDVVLIAVGQKVHLEVDAFKDQKFEGVVTDIANSAKNNDTSTTGASSSSSSPQDATKFQVKIRILEHEIFLPGMSVSADIETRSRTNVLTVPIQCVTMRPPKPGATTNNLETNSTIVMNTDPHGVTSNSPATNVASVSVTSTNAVDAKKAAEALKPVQVIFVVEGDHVKAESVQTGIEDDNYVEVVSGLKEGDQVVSGGSKVINRELQDGSKVMLGAAKSDAPEPK
ncbi:MAG TPA: efflux RND transporter periplasmic adaptor subunit [Verrucomicrobiae bacterium]|nr:efflux RND transporter periplasmic adaptor subunit [Verrucomicrobiae bacterium]